jgi:glycosyltransferase involved in cell wall biosynthesis
MCTFNGAKFLHEQLSSIAAQSVPVQEIVICDDCSEDETCTIIESFCRQHPGLIRLHRNSTRLGVSQNFAQAISLCRGDIIFLSDQDDRWLPTKVQRMAALFASDPQCDVVSVAATVTDINLKPTGKTVSAMFQTLDEKPSTFSARIHQSSAFGCTLAFRASLGPLIFPISPHWGHDNWICFIASRFTQIRGIEEPLMLYRRHRDAAGMHDKLDFGYFGQLVAAAKRSKRIDYEHDLQKWQDMKQQLIRIFENNSMNSFWHGILGSKDAILDEVQARLEFSKRRLNIVARTRPLRLGPALRVFLAGQYAEFASGWKSFVRDLFIA